MTAKDGELRSAALHKVTVAAGAPVRQEDGDLRREHLSGAPVASVAARSAPTASDAGDLDLVDILALSAPVPKPLEARDIGRNEPCPCGSHRKFKKCCLPRIEAGERPNWMR